MVKRLIDLAFSMAALVLLLPVFLLVAIAIKLDSPGPVLYAQKRVGRRGKTFRILKFRSMVVDAEQAGPALTGNDDPRVTRVGRWLRLLKIDELPQLINVLTGDMSLVGPRPEIPAIVEQYTEEQRQVLEVKPGITGPTQLAWIDESETFPPGIDVYEHYTKQFMREKLESDREYVRTRSLAGDLWYVIRTPMAIGGRILTTLNPPPHIQKYASLTLDCLAVVAANLSAFMVRFDWALPEKEMQHLLYGLPVACAAYLIAFVTLRTHRSIWKFAGVEDLWQIIKASALGVGLHGFAVVLLGWHGYPRSILILTAPLTVLLAGGMRLVVRSSVQRQETTPSTTNSRKVVIIGAGETGELIAREILGNPSSGYGLIGFVDDDPQKQGATVHGRPVLGTIDRLPDIAKTYAIQEAIIAISTATGNGLRRIGGICAGAGLEFKTLPSFTQLVRGDGNLRYLRKMNVDELLGREPVAINREAIAGFFRGKRVMVTGAGGSIGSELCRQLISCGVESLIMVERAENALHHISLEIRQHSPEANVTAALADVKHIPRMSEIFERTRPQVVFHAAAYKHVPILEDHPGEAILNNIIGTKRLAEVAQKFDVNTFVFISTDKAVRPKSLMGATKKVSEMYIMALNRVLRQSHGPGRIPPHFFIVRFGNVLGSAGSVVPLFQKQIEDGEQITITDPQMSRYFMTISEAVGLVLQSSTMDCEEDVFILNMGEPIKIDELVNDLALTSGLNPSQVTKRYIGLRPGEKLHESLWDDEEVLASEYGMIFAVRQPQVSFGDMEERLNRLETLAMVGNVPALLQQLHDIIPSYAPSLKESAFSVPEVGEKYHILVIDDDETLCDLVKEAVNGTYEMATASSARDGFDQIQRQRPHLILLDVKLPDQNGLQVCHALRDHPQYRNIPIIMMTGYGDKDDVVTGLKAGADDYLAKPFRLEELRARIEAVLRRTGGTVHPALPAVSMNTGSA